MTLIGNYIKHEEEYVKRYGPKTIFLIQCGSFFEVYCCKKGGQFTNNRIMEFSQICDMRIAKKKAKHEGLAVFMSGFPEIQLEKYVKRLNEAGYTVPVWIQEPTNPKIRKEYGIFSPGTNFDLNTHILSNKIMTVWIELYDKTLINKKPRVSCGIACIDIVSGDVFTFQNIENYFHTPATFDELERFYCSYKPNELVIIHNCSDLVIKDIISFADIDSSLIHILSMDGSESDWDKAIKNCQKETYHETELIRFYDISDYDVFYDTHKLRERKFSTQSLVFLLNFLDFHNHDLVKQLKIPDFINIDERLRLGNHSLRQLNIISTGHKGKLSSLETLVNKCKTSMGKRYLRHKLLNPITDPDYLQSEYEIQDYVKNQFSYDEVFSSLEQITDFERLFRKIILGRIVPSDLAILYENLKVISKIHQTTITDSRITEYLNSAKPDLKHVRPEGSTRLESKRTNSSSCSTSSRRDGRRSSRMIKGQPELNTQNLSKSVQNLRKKIKHSVDIKIASNISSCNFDVNIFIRGKGNFTRLDNVEYEYVEKLNRLEAIRSFLDGLIVEKSTRSKEKVKVHYTEKSGQFLITTKTRWKKLKSNLTTHSKANVNTLIYNCFNKEERFQFEQSKIEPCATTGNNIRLDSPQLIRLYGEILSKKSNFKEILTSIYKNYISTFLEYKDDFTVIIQYLVKLDFLLARVDVAKDYNYCKPVIDMNCKQSFINAKDMRHPLIEYIQDKEIYVPNDVTLGLDYTGILLFGTNAVGKSSLIRAIGMTVVLAQAGFFVPCSSFTFKPYTSIFTRILGNDDIFKGLSSFAVEMSELGSILRGANKSSLVLGDELCRGTETSSALCIIQAGLTWLHHRNSSFIFATHFHELTDKPKIIKLKRLVMKHMVVEYDIETGGLVYNRKLKNGPGTRLYGLEVCKSLCMPREFLDLANSFRCAENNNIVLSRKSTRYNTKKIKGMCENCGIKAKDIHHMNPQKFANSNGFINTFHKNHKANLMAICGKCHKKFTEDEIIHRRVKTSEGYRLNFEN